LLVFADSAGEPRGWRLLSGGAVVGRGDDITELTPQQAWVRVVLAVPGTDVTILWLELAETLTPAQAAAAARLQIAEESAEPIAAMHVAAGRRENGLTAIALVPVERMDAWMAGAREMSMEPDVILPAPMLLMPPGEGLVCYRGGEVPDYRGTARAFSLEDEIAELVLGDTNATEVGDDLREAQLAPVLADPPINLRQGAFGRRRQVVIDWNRTQWLLTLATLLLLASLVIEIVTIVRTNIAAAHYEGEAQEARQAMVGPGPRARPSAARYGSLATALFEAVRETPTAELTQMVYLPDGSMRASVLADSQPTIDALRARIEARGVQAAGGLPTNLGGRAAGDITIRPR
jgi:general secretion pathway protein L